MYMLLCCECFAVDARTELTDVPTIWQASAGNDKDKKKTTVSASTVVWAKQVAAQAEQLKQGRRQARAHSSPQRPLSARPVQPSQPAVHAPG